MGVSWWMFVRDTPLAPPSIVVLPFTDLTTGKTEQAFCDGLTEETSNWLAQLPTLRVVARTSAFAVPRSQRRRAHHRTRSFKPLICSKVRCDAQVTACASRCSSSTRATGFHVWSESYDKEANDVLEVQEDIARKVADNLELRITAETDSRFAGRRSKSAEAQTPVSARKAHSAQQDGESLERAIDLYRAGAEG